jgi:hypothetical protein
MVKVVTKENADAFVTSVYRVVVCRLLFVDDKLACQCSW